MIRIAIAVIVGILLIGLLFKLIKVAIIVALGVAVVMFVSKQLGTKRIK